MLSMFQYPQFLQSQIFLGFWFLLVVGIYIVFICMVLFKIWFLIFFVCDFVPNVDGSLDWDDIKFDISRFCWDVGWVRFILDWDEIQVWLS